MSLKNKQYWRSLDQLDGTAEFKRFLKAEFPEDAREENGDQVSRRQFLGLFGASMALAGLVNCRRPVEKIIPHVIQPEDRVPGVPVDYRTTMPFGNSAYGLTVRTYDGRPVKIEGSPAHPSTLGKSNAFMQAEILNLYDPDRSKSVLFNGAERTWDDFVVAWRELYKENLSARGEGLAILSPSFSSPTLSRLAKDFFRNFPRARWIVYDAITDENIYKGVKAATGRDLFPHYKFENAQVVVALDADFLMLESESLNAARGFAKARTINSVDDEINRLYVIESGWSVTGAMADHRHVLPGSQIGAYAAALALELKSFGLNVPGIDNISPEISQKIDKKWLTEVAKDLLIHLGESIVIAGRTQSLAVHALVLAINSALGNVGRTIDYRLKEDEFTPDANELALLKSDIDNGLLKTLIILGGNPVYDAAVTLNIKKVDCSIHLSDRVNETSQLATWHIPAAHFLESWGDARSIDGTPSIIQPMIEPLHGGKSDVEVLNLVATGQDERGYDIVRMTWQSMLPRRDFENSWRKILHDGMVQNESRTIVPYIQSRGVQTALDYYPVDAPSPTKESLEVLLVPSTQVFDGRYANNGWLLENPDPLTKLTWDNAALLSPQTAQELGLKNNDLVTIKVTTKSITLPVWIVPGIANFVIAIPLGFGRSAAGRVGNNVGVNAFKLRSQANSYILGEAHATKATGTYQLASTQDHGSMEGRPLVREASIEEYRQHPEFAQEMVEHPPLKSLWKEHKYEDGYQWGMVIDLNTCIGCGVCTVACQSENNITIVGKEQVANGREMHWIRVDRYFEGDPAFPRVVHQPVACQHCEMAPCEGVCPVAATVHDAEGLNLMVYNRCVGTRYCSNNCPYKVRRFNFFNYIKDYAETIKMVQNPNVTVRSRGVMEKCTFCLQRINEAKFNAKQQDREIQDGDIQTACQQACPTNAIKFGNILDPGSEVAHARQNNRNYGILSELNLKTRTSFLAKLRNPNSNLA
ncbi:TAT-variant-translocated molybdopterin oxidoreductase [candidate division KSB1 bacterium]|nr:TAT-variant-translocated molybdopterin oxidoreductase [candidate division KSB1 bacterium]